MGRLPGTVRPVRSQGLTSRREGAGRDDRGQDRGSGENGCAPPPGKGGVPGLTGRDILAVAEHREGRVVGATYELVAKGRDLAAATGGSMRGALLGPGLRALRGAPRPGAGGSWPGSRRLGPRPRRGAPPGPWRQSCPGPSPGWSCSRTPRKGSISRLGWRRSGARPWSQTAWTYGWRMGGAVGGGGNSQPKTPPATEGP